VALGYSAFEDAIYRITQVNREDMLSIIRELLLHGLVYEPHWDFA